MRTVKYGSAERGCPFCADISFDLQGSGLNPLVVDYPDNFPLSDGHTLVMPTRHVQYLQDLTHDEMTALWSRVHRVVLRLGECNVGVNNGVCAGQTVPHLHVHVIPRCMGDVADPRGGVRWVIPEKADYWSVVV